MTSALRLIFNKWVLTGVAVVAIALLIWWVGPTISIKTFYPFESELVRWIQIAILALTPIVRWTWRAISARRANKQLEDGLLQPAPGQAGKRVDASAGEVAQLRQRFEQAMDLLGKRRFGTEKPSLWARLGALGSQQYLYDLPWYVFIGAPGAGKTTALVNSGLRFPLASRLGRDAVRGVGGTRDCDWLFTDEAVFLDTAGRYTTQQSNQEVDAGAWKGFLQLLKKSRPRRPINGVLVTVSVSDLLQQSPSEREAHSEAIRSRVKELYEQLAVHFPVYVLVTKSDLIAGFSEFFAELGKEDRTQVWGISFPFGESTIDPAALSAELARLEHGLYDRLPDRLEEERDPAKRALLYSFPQQFARLRDRLVDFVDATFAPSKFETPALLRGVYFTSGTQEGSPIDRVMGAFAREVGLERQLLPVQYPSGRSYFLTRLLREVVFPEAGLAGFDLRGERRRRWIQNGAIAGAAAVVLLATGAWWISYRHNREYLAEVAAQFEATKKQIADLRTAGMNDLSALLLTLSSVRNLAESRAFADGSVPWSWRFGLYQGYKLEAASRAAYRRMLQDAYLPSLAMYLQRSLRDAASGNPDESYETLKTYVMLYDAKRFNRDGVWGWYGRRKANLLPGAGPDEQNVIKSHFDALYERGWVDPATPRDDAVLASVRAAIGRESLPQRIYDRLKREPIPDARDFTIADKSGPKAMLVFERPSRQPLAKGVPALYTKDVYYKQFSKRLDLIALQLAEEETWVLGTGSSALAGAASSPQVADAVKRLYLEDYRRTWRDFIADIGVIRERDLTRLIDVARTLSAPDSPLKALVKAIDRETTLSIPPDGDPGIVGAVTGKAQQYASKARAVVTGSPPGALEKTLVDDQFEEIHRLAGSANAPGPIDGLVQQLNEFYQFLVAAKVASDARQKPPPAESINKLRADADRQPEPIRSMLRGQIDLATRVVSEIERRAELQDGKTTK